MPPQAFDDIDRLIESALKQERMQSLPPGFGARAQERVAIAALVMRERRRFRRCLAVGILGIASVMTSGAMAAFFGGLPAAIAESVPGAMGFYDQLSVFVSVWWPGLAGVAILTVCALALGVLVAEAVPSRRRLTAL